MKNLLVMLFYTTVITSCKDQYKDCPNRAPDLYIFDYDSSQIDSLMIAMYEKRSNFSKKISDTLMVYNGQYDVKKGVDSFLLFPSRLRNYAAQYENYDWRYTILYDGNHVDVTNAVRKIHKTSINHPEPACNSPIVEATIDGRPVKDEDGIEDIYLKKP